MTPRALRTALNLVAAVVLGVLLVWSAHHPVGRPAVTLPEWARVLVALTAAATVVSRGRAPLVSLAVGLATGIGSYLSGFERAGFVTVALVLYTVATSCPPRRSLAALGGTAVAVIATTLAAPVPRPVWAGPPPYTQLVVVALSTATVAAAGWALGFAVYRQREYLQAVRLQAAGQVRAQQELAARSAAEERLRIARELHDVVAHAMSVITVQAGVARYVVTDRPGQTAQALEAIEATGRQALLDMRQLLGVLRQDGEVAAHAPAPGLSDLDELFARTDAAGVRVELTTRGVPRRLPGAVELSAYRIIQEALTNVVKHAATDHARVRLDYGDPELAVEIIDDGAGPGAGGPPGGHGLTGMRERAAMHGGTLQAGPLPLRGYRVAARLPAPTSAPAPAPVPDPVTG